MTRAFKQYKGQCKCVYCKEQENINPDYVYYFYSKYPTGRIADEHKNPRATR